VDRPFRIPVQRQRPGTRVVLTIGGREPLLVTPFHSSRKRDPARGETSRGRKEPRDIASRGINVIINQQNPRPARKEIKQAPEHRGIVKISPNLPGLLSGACLKGSKRGNTGEHTCSQWGAGHESSPRTPRTEGFSVSGENWGGREGGQRGQKPKSVLGSGLQF